eukprot:TRINITY_DN67797_c0_g1_i1.p1 TRINITY_DN67797_c0_g1~~TRINITY_DN67797_c0_g1_i1.p1  ORF type:complete len:799 (-),score=100.55 TRINITY_DN67797_c0_g1_i1:231-2627(-)
MVFTTKTGTLFELAGQVQSKVNDFFSSTHQQRLRDEGTSFIRIDVGVSPETLSALSVYLDASMLLPRLVVRPIGDQLEESSVYDGFDVVLTLEANTRYMKKHPEKKGLCLAPSPSHLAHGRVQTRDFFSPPLPEPSILTTSAEQATVSQSDIQKKSPCISTSTTHELPPTPSTRTGSEPVETVTSCAAVTSEPSSQTSEATVVDTEQRCSDHNPCGDPLAIAPRQLRSRSPTAVASSSPDPSLSDGDKRLLAASTSTQRLVNDGFPSLHDIVESQPSLNCQDETTSSPPQSLHIEQDQIKTRLASQVMTTAGGSAKRLRNNQSPLDKSEPSFPGRTRCQALVAVSTDACRLPVNDQRTRLAHDPVPPAKGVDSARTVAISVIHEISESQPCFNDCSEVGGGVIDRTIEPASSPAVPVFEKGVQNSTTIICSATPRLQQCSSPSGTHGALINRGSTCYLNAVVQAVRSLREFVESLRRVSTSLQAGEGGILACTIDVLERLEDADATLGPTDPVKLRRAITRRAPKFGRGLQQDAHEFLVQYMMMLHDEMLSAVAEADRSRPVPTHSHFASVVKKLLVCAQCGVHREIRESFHDFSLDFGVGGYGGVMPVDGNGEMGERGACDGESSSLVSMLRNFFADEALQAKCDYCGAQEAQMKKFLVESPRVLVLHLKRFRLSIRSGHYQKCGSRVSIPLDLALDVWACPQRSRPVSVSSSEDLDVTSPPRDVMTPSLAAKYQLRSCVAHDGCTPSSGHYVCYARGRCGTWGLYDDAYVRDCVISDSAAPSELEQKAYLLFYVRC